MSNLFKKASKKAATPGGSEQYTGIKAPGPGVDRSQSITPARSRVRRKKLGPVKSVLG